MRLVSWLEDLVLDLQFAGRALRKSPGFAAIAILTLALGIGANTALFSVVNAVLLKPLPYVHPEQIVALAQTESAPGSYPLTGEDYLDWRAQNSTFQDMSLYSWPSNFNVSGIGGTAEGLEVVRTQANFFPLLGVPPQLGRTFAEGEDQKGAAHVAILSNRLWKERFAGRPDTLGKTILLNGESYTIIGVQPAWFSVPGRADIWVPLDMSKESVGTRGNHSWQAIGRIKNGVTLAQASADLRTIAERIEKQFPNTNHRVDAIVTPMRQQLVGDFQTQLWILFGAVGLVLLIASTNVANLLLARATGRRREVAVRTALGASTGRLVRQLLTESLLLSFLGGAVGLYLAFAGVAGLRQILPPQVPQPNPIAVDLTALAFAFGTCVVIGLLFGLVPALQSVGIASAEALKPKNSIGSGASGRGHLLRDVLVASEIALSLALLIGAGLLIRTFANLRATDVGIRGEHVLTASVRLPQSGYSTFGQRRDFYERLLQKLQTMPGADCAAITTKLPLRGGNNSTIQIPGRADNAFASILVETTAMRGDYFRAFGIPLLAGRELRQEDFDTAAKFMEEILPTKTAEESQAIVKKYVLPAVINQTMAKTFWLKQDAVGKVFKQFATFQVVGVVGDVKQQGLRDAAMPEAYYPIEWNLSSPWPFSIVIHSLGSPESLTAAVRSALQSQDSSLALMKIRAMPQIMEESMTDTSYEAGLLTGMAALALLLAAVGIYGVMSYMVGQRTNEIGIRMALGASRAQILGMVLRQAGLRLGSGIAIGLLIALGAAQLMKGLLVGVKPFDASTYCGVTFVLAAVALAACYFPAQRALRVDPIVALRDE